jgi:outer membrane protein TolC
MHIKIQNFSYLCFIIFLFFIYTNITRAQETKKVLTLDECISIALKNNLKISIAEKELAFYKEKEREAHVSTYFPKTELKNLFGPVPDARGSVADVLEEYHLSWGDISENLGFFYRLEFETIQPLYTFGKISSAKNLAAAGVNASIANKKREEADLILDVKKIYFTILLLTDLMDVIDDAEKKLALANSKLEEFLAKGSEKVSNLDKHKIKVYSLQLQKKRASLEQGLNIAKSTLKTLLHFQDDTDIQITPIEFNNDKIMLRQLNQYIIEAENKRPEIKQMLAGIEAQKALLKINKADFFPSFFLGGKFRYSVAPGRTDQLNPFVNDDFNFLEAGVAVGFVQNLSFWITKKKFNEEKINFLKLIKQKELLIEGIKLSVIKTYNELLEAKKKLALSREEIKAARSWLTETAQGFDLLGDVGVKDLAESFFAYAKARTDFYENIFAFENTKSKLEREINENIK